MLLMDNSKQLFIPGFWQAICSYYVRTVVLKGPQSRLKRMDAFCVRKESNMLWTICVILLVLWLLGLVSGYTMGGVIHILLVIAIIVVLVRVIQGRKIL